jgi:galactokinase
MKKLDAIISPTLVGILDKLNDLTVQKEDIVSIIQNTEGQYVAIFYV